MISTIGILQYVAPTMIFLCAVFVFDEPFGTARMVREKAGVPAPAKKTTARKSAQKGSKVEPKYRNPANPAETWAGRGMPPKWMSAELAKGRKLEDFLIAK